MSKKETIKLINGKHRDIDVVFIKFAYSEELIRQVKRINGIVWSQSYRCWYLPVEQFYLNSFFKQLQPYAFIDYSDLKDNKDTQTIALKTTIKKRPTVKLPEGYIKMLEQRRYSENTKKVYKSYFIEFVCAFAGKDLKEITKQDLNNYIYGLIKEKKIS